MELFYSRDIDGSICRLDQDESGHCVKVLRHRAGDEISVIDGCGTLYRCRIVSDSHKGVEATVLSSQENWGGHPYRLHLAVCPTKSNDRYEWFAEKACEIGFDELSPVIGEHSERKVLKTVRVEKVLISAAKQSLKASVPKVNEPVSRLSTCKLKTPVAVNSATHLSPDLLKLKIIAKKIKILLFQIVIGYSFLVAFYVLVLLANEP